MLKMIESGTLKVFFKFTEFLSQKIKSPFALSLRTTKSYIGHK